MFYTSVCQVQRLTPTLDADGGMSLLWNNLTTIVDPVYNQPGLLQCRIDLQFLRPGKDQPMPLVAGRAPDRTGLAIFDLATDSNGIPLVLAGDRLVCVQGPIFGTFDIRLIPDVAQSLTGAHHVETQIIEVSQLLQQGSPTPFPGSP